MTSFRQTARVATLLFVLIAIAEFAKAQTTQETMTPLLDEQVQPKAVTAYQVQKYLMKGIPKPLVPATAEQWDLERKKLRNHVMKDVAYHGWPQDWINSAPRF